MLYAVTCYWPGATRASDRLGIPREWLMDSLWIGPARLTTSRPAPTAAAYAS